MSLCLTIYYGQYVLINDTKIYIEKYNHKACRVKFEAPKDTIIKREGLENNVDKVTYNQFLKLSEQEREFYIVNIRSKMEYYLAAGKHLTEAQGLVSNDLRLSGRVIIEITNSMKYNNRKAWLKK